MAKAKLSPEQKDRIKDYLNMLEMNYGGITRKFNMIWAEGNPGQYDNYGEVYVTDKNPIGHVKQFARKAPISFLKIGDETFGVTPRRSREENFGGRRHGRGR